MSKKERRMTAQALLAFVNLRKSEEQRFITTMNLLLRVSPQRRREIIDELKKEAAMDAISSDG